MNRKTLGPSLVGSSCCALILASLLPTTVAQADDSAPLEAGVFVGMHGSSKASELGVNDNDPDTFDNAPGIGLRLGFRITDLISAEAEGAVLPGTTRATDTSSTALAWRLQARIHPLASSSKLQPFAVLGGGGLSLPSGNDALESDTDLALHIGAGATYRLTDRIGVRVDLRALFPPSSSSDGATTSWELWAGLAVPLGGSAGPQDSDGDGIPDARDKCPNDAENKNGVEDEDGCPEPEDPDADGVIGAADKCPNEPEDKDSFQDDDGCPDKDNDGDGIPDATDKCPMEAESANGLDDEDGCPEKDEDEDGIFGSADRCPADAEDMDGHEDTDGCPDTDNDGDGVVDAADGCPAKAGPIDNKGCPDTDEDGDGVVDRLDNCPKVAGSAANFGCKKKQLVKIVGAQLKILQKVHFAKNRVRIRSRSRKLLDNVARVIIAQKGIAKVLVEGHTDDQGDAAANKDLSQRRAEAVVNWLVKKGVSADRLQAVGYGEEKAIDDNTTKKGRAANRRVEFKIVDDTVVPAAPATP